MKNRILSLFLTLAMCLSLGTFILPQQARAESYQTFDTSKTYFLWLKEANGARRYRWNADGTGKRDVIHLDVPSGANCVMTFTASKEAGYYGIRCKDRYINTKDNNEKAGQYLHQWEDFYEGDNQKFRFIPVPGEADTYYIQMKKGGLYVGLQGNQAAQHSIIETADDAHKCKWVVLPSDWAPFPTDKSQEFDTSRQYYLWLKEGDAGTYDYRWNADGTGQGKVIHLDIPAGGNCRFTFTPAAENGWYGIRCTEGDRYVDTDENDKMVSRVLHQWSKDLKQDNQKFRFIPVEGESNTYYIQAKNSGLYVCLNGFNESERYRTLMVGDGEFACKWEVVPTEPPLEPNALLPGAKDHVGYPADGALTFMMNPVGYLSGLSVNNDAKVVGNKVHLWTMGHICKVTAEYIGTDRNGNTQDAYRIRSFDYFETSTNYWENKDFVWDVDDQSKRDGAVIHVWEEGGDDKASTLWRFIPAPGQEDVYYIQNVNSHLYVGLESEEDRDGVTLKQTSKKVPWEIHWLYAGSEDSGDKEPGTFTPGGEDPGSTTYYGYSVDEDGNVTDPSAPMNSGNWMSRLPDELPLSQINIPGTHDAAATRFWTSFSNFINEGVGQILAQMLYIDEQFNAGVRAWDIRVSNHEADASFDPSIIHGKDLVICHDRYGNTLHLSTVIETAAEFLRTHPKETIVIKLSGQGNGNSLNVITALSKYVLIDLYLSDAQKKAIAEGRLTYDDIGPKYPIYIPSKEDLNTRVPTLGEVRGKIVFLNGAGVPFYYEDPKDTKSDKIPIEFSSDLEEYQFRAAGPNIEPWVISDLELDPPKTLQEINNTCAWAQDVFNLGDGKVKMEYVDGSFDDLEAHHQTDTAYVLNFASAHDDIDVSKDIFQRLMADSTLDQTSGTRKNTGILFVNELDPLLARRIYMTNFDGDGTALPAAWGVFFDSAGGSAVPSQHVNTGKTADRPKDPVKNGYTFQGWQLDGQDYDFTAPVTEPITLTALWKENSSGGGSGGGGGGGGAVTYAVSLRTDPADASRGKIAASLANARSGQKVTLTLSPDEGWQGAGVTVTDKNGNAVTVTKNDDGTYSFTMPAGAVTVTPAFEELRTPEVPDGPSAPGTSDESKAFRDVPEDAWFRDAVAWAVSEGVMNGVSETSFAPDASCTRAMVVTMLWRLEGEPEHGSDPFDDVAAGSWYEQAVAWAAEQGVVKGFSETAFRPEDSVTREQLAAILYRYAGYKGTAVSPDANILDYADALDVSDWAVEAMRWAVQEGIVQGVGGNRLAPGSGATRAQIAAMFLRFCQQPEK